MAKVSLYATGTLADGSLFYCVPSAGLSRKVTLAAIRAALYRASSILKLTKGADVASANALVLGTDGNSFDITGTTPITSIGTIGVGTTVILHFDGILVLGHHATDLILPGGANITTAAGDIATFYEYATGDWRCVTYQRAHGRPLFSDAKGADVASASALTLGIDGNSFDITGTTTITSINTLKVGSIVTLHFDGALVLTHHATDLILPGAANITTAAGDIATFYEYATGDWRCITYQRKSAMPTLEPAAGMLRPVYLDAAPQALSGPGAVNITSPVTNVTTTGATDALTLADAAVLGLMKVINHAVDGGGYVLTPTTLSGGTTITVTAPGVSITLMWTATGWRLVSQTGVAVIA